MSDKTLSFTQRSLAEALDNVRCLSDLGPELIAAQVFAASAQQPAQAVPDGWKLVPFHATREQVNAVFMHPDLARTLYRNMVEAAPAAPVAQEPVAWRVSEPSEPSEPEIGHWLSEEPGTSWQRSEPLYTAPPAAEQPDVEYPPCDYCGASMEYMPWHGSGLINGVESRHIHACDNCRRLLPAAEQPDAAPVPRELLERHLDEVGEYAWETYDEMRALLGKDGEA